MNRPGTSTNSKYLATGDPLADICCGYMWTIYQLSPLYILGYSPEELDLYASKVKSEIDRTIVDYTVNTFDVTFEELPYLKYTDSDASGLMISVKLCAEENNIRKPAVVIYSAILLSWGLSMNVDGAIHLPYMLESGNQKVKKVSRAVKSTLCGLFNCNFSQFNFTQPQLLQFGFNLVNISTTKGPAEFKIFYEKTGVAQSETSEKETMLISFDIEFVKQLWNSARTANKYELAPIYNKQEVQEAYTQLLDEINFNFARLNLSYLKIYKVAMPDAEIVKNGALTINTPEFVKFLFIMLNDLMYSTGW